MSFLNHSKIKSIIKTLRPWVVTIVIVLILRFTGILSGLSVLANSAVMQTGALDFNPESSETRDQRFNYDFTIKDLNGAKVDFNQYKGKVIFLNLWATWCGPCRVEMPSIQSLYESVDKDKVAFVMLSLDKAESQKKVASYVENQDFTFPVFVVDEWLPEQLQVPSIPTTLIISKDGLIRSKKVGTANYDTDKFREYLKSLTENQ